MRRLRIMLPTVSLLAIFSQTSTGLAQNAQAPITAQEAAGAQDVMTPGLLPEMTLGNPDAPARLVVYLGDSHTSAKFYFRVLSVLRKKYVRAGKLLLIAREMPGNDFVFLVRCAPKGDYFKVWDMIYTALEDEWNALDRVIREGGIPPSPDSAGQFRGLLAKAGIPLAKYEACAGDKALRDGLAWEAGRVKKFGAGSVLNGEALHFSGVTGGSDPVDENLAIVGIQTDLAIQRAVKRQLGINQGEQELLELRKEYGAH